MIRKSVKRFSEKIIPKQGVKRDDDSTQSHRALGGGAQSGIPLTLSPSGRARRRDEIGDFHLVLLGDTALASSA
jgi:hypothetical protein